MSEKKPPTIKNDAVQNDAKMSEDAVPGGAKGAPTSGETGGPKGLEPTRYGDWERKGRCVDF